MTFIEKLMELPKSRRFLAAVGAMLAIGFHETLGFSEDDVNKVVGIVITWILGDSYRPTEARKKVE